MKKTILFVIIGWFLSATVMAEPVAYKPCASWDTFCKNSAQIVATKCRLGVPVYHEQCQALGLPNRRVKGYSNKEGLPVTAQLQNKTTLQILQADGWL